MAVTRLTTSRDTSNRDIARRGDGPYPHVSSNNHRAVARRTTRSGRAACTRRIPCTDAEWQRSPVRIRPTSISCHRSRGYFGHRSVLSLNAPRVIAGKTSALARLPPEGVAEPTRGLSVPCCRYLLSYVVKQSMAGFTQTLIVRWITVITGEVRPLVVLSLSGATVLTVTGGSAFRPNPVVGSSI